MATLLHGPVATPTPEVLGDALLREIAGQGGVQRYRKGRTLISQDDLSDTLYIILSGRVKVHYTDLEDKELVIIEYGPGEYVGELALDGGKRSASVTTLETTYCSVVTGSTLREFIRAHPEFAAHLVRKLIWRVRMATDSLVSIALQDVYARLVQFLMEHASPTRSERASLERFTQRDIAERIGSSREMVSRLLKEMKNAGLVSIVGSKYSIIRPLPPRREGLKPQSRVSHRLTR